jgi:GNAT superfamily N-acetyltransferase
VRRSLNINPVTDEHWLELHTDNNELAARVRWTPTTPEATSTEFLVTPEHQAQGLGKQLIIELLTTLKDTGCTTARLVNVQASSPFIKYGCVIDNGDAIVDLSSSTLDDLILSISENA